MSPSKFRLRRVFRGPVYLMARLFVYFGVHPTTITYFSLLIAIFAFLTLLLTQNIPLFGVLVFLCGLLDGVDGAVARLSNAYSIRGAFLDSIIDKVSEGLILLAIALTFPYTLVFGFRVSSWAFLCLLSWLLVSYTRSRAESLGVGDLDVGLGARSERLFVLVVFSLLNLLFVGLFLATLLGIFTAAYRWHHYSQQLAKLQG